LLPVPAFFFDARFPVPGFIVDDRRRVRRRLNFAFDPRIRFPVPAAPSPGMPGVCFPGPRILNPAFTLNDVAKKQHFPPGGIAVKKVTL
jgi:hypothetical protein